MTTLGLTAFGLAAFCVTYVAAYLAMSYDASRHGGEFDVREARMLGRRGRL